jgi:hypothetical protein
VRVWFAGCRAAVQLGHRKRGCGQANRGGFTSASASRAPGLHPRNEDLDAPAARLKTMIQGSFRADILESSPLRMWSDNQTIFSELG